MILRTILPLSRPLLSSSFLSNFPFHHQPTTQYLLPSTSTISLRNSPPSRLYTSSLADSKIEEIQELYFTARDEFEIASEETTKKTVYAADDRAAAQEEFEKLKKAYKEAVEGTDEEVGKEIQRRIGQRVRELERGMEALEERAKED